MEPQWIQVLKGSRKGTDLLLAPDGNTFTRRSPFVWQCTKRNGLQKCPALVREKNGDIIVIKENHVHN